METFSALLAICAWNSPVTGEFPAQTPVTRSFDVFFDLRLHKRLSKQSKIFWFMWTSTTAQLKLSKKTTPGARPTNDISIEFEIRSKFAVL